MSIEHMAIVLHHSRAKGTAKLVALGIANHQGDGGAWPTHATLATYANVDVSNVRKAIRQLRSMGELSVYVQEGGTPDCPDEVRPNLYELLISCPPWCDRSPNHRDTRKLASGRQDGLWINREAIPPTVGGSAQGRWAHPPRGGRAAAPTKPSTTTTTHQEVATPQDTRACVDCGQGEARCQQLQARWPAEDRHAYRHAEG